jgi:iron complex outermembrane receptor protein
MVLISGAWLFAQERSVSGTVKDAATGEGIPGVNILIQGTTSGSVSDIDGKFQLQVPAGAVTLVLSYVGYKTVTVDVAAAQSTVDVSLESDVTALSEVVVVGYGTQEKKEITSAVSSVKAAEFNKGSVNDPAQLIQGKVPGLSITHPGGNPNRAYDIRLRGMSTVGQGTSPLIVVDGVPGASLDNVDPNDIESIDVLKDGSSAAIYGTRGSAGVILVTTKSGREGHFNIDYNGYVTSESPSKFVPVLSAQEWRDFSNVVSAGVDYQNSTDWFKEITRTAYTHVHNLSLSGGTKQTNYRASINVHDAQGIAINTGFKDLNGRLNLQQKALKDRLTATLDFAGTYKQSKYGFDEAFRYATIYNPTAPAKVDPSTPLPSGGLTYQDYLNNWDGYYNLPGSFDYYNPLQILEQNINDGVDKRINLSGRLAYEIIPNLVADAFYSLQSEDFLRGRYYDKNSFWVGANQNGEAVREFWQNNSQLFESTLKWNGTVMDNLNVSALAGYSYQDFNHDGYSVDAGNFLTDAFTYNNLAAAKYFQDGLATINGSNEAYRNSSKLIAFFGRLNLNYNETYFLSASLRHEGSSKFGANNKWGNFPAISGGVELANFIGSSAIDNLKVRVSYGITGQIPNDSYVSLLRFQKTGNFLYNGNWIPTYGPASNANPDLKWEKKDELNFGIDYSFFGSKLFGSIEYYQRNTKDLIFDFTVPVPPNLFQTQTVNVGEIQNKGLELALSFRAVDNPMISWTPTITGTWYIENKLVSLSSPDGTYEYGVRDLGDFGSPGQNQTPLVRVQEGQPIGQIWGLVYEGIDESGNWKFKDVNGDGTASGGDEDRAVIGNGLPKYDLGFANSITIAKNFDVNVFFRGTFGHDLVNQFRGFYEVPNLISAYNILQSSRDLKSPGGTLLSVNSGKFSSLHVEKGDFFKLDNFSIGYTVPLKPNSQVKKVRIYFAGNNTFILTGYKGVDPEVRWVDTEDNDNVLVPGIDRRNTWFRTRSWTLGVQVGL